MIRDIYEIGYPILLVRAYTTPNEITDALSKYEDKRVSIRQIIDELEKISGKLWVRATAAFSPDRWWYPPSWGYYAWPSDTLKEELGDVTGTLMRYERRIEDYGLPSESEEAFMTMSGLGIVSSIVEGATQKGAVETTEPVYVLVTNIPRRTVTFIQDPNNPTTIHAYTAHYEAKNILHKHGYREINKTHSTKTYKNETEALEDLAKIDQELRKQNIDTFMLKNLREKVKTLNTQPQ